MWGASRESHGSLFIPPNESLPTNFKKRSRLPTTNNTPPFTFKNQPFPS